MENSEKFITKLPILNSDSLYVVNSTWSSEEISFEIVDCSPKTHDYEWTGSVLIDEVKQSARELEIPYDEFYNECKNALTKAGGLLTFSYSIEGDKFILRKIENFKIVYLELKLISALNLSRQLLLKSIDKITTTQCAIKEMKKEVHKINHDYQTAQATFKTCVQEKNRLERSILTKCMCLLNTKKETIVELQRLLQNRNESDHHIDRKDIKIVDREPQAQEHPNPVSASSCSGTSIEASPINNEKDFDYSQPTQVMPQNNYSLIKRQKFSLNTLRAESVSIAKVDPIPTTSKQEEIIEAASDNSENMFENM